MSMFGASDTPAPPVNVPGTGKLHARFVTSMGDIECVLHEKDAPRTVANFVALATGSVEWTKPDGTRTKAPLYSGTVFHRVIPDFMIQGGDPTGTGTSGPGYNFADETSTADKMAPGTLAMANAGPSTNGSQFFITEGAPEHLNGKHTIFGTCAPIDVVKKIARVKAANDKPETAVKMKVTISRGTL